jgi:hypothetical protein
MEKRMEILKQANEEKLLKANEVLTYLGRRHDIGMVPRQLNGVTDTSVPVQMVHCFQTFEQESNTGSNDEESNSIDQHSIDVTSSAHDISSTVSKPQCDDSKTAQPRGINRSGNVVMQHAPEVNLNSEMLGEIVALRQDLYILKRQIVSFCA